MTTTGPSRIVSRSVVIHDATLRDGHHVARHQFTGHQLHSYASAASAAGVGVVEVGHGNGLGASSLQIGRARLTDREMLVAVRGALNESKLGVFMAPGWGTTRDLRVALSLGVQVVRVAAHCTEADVTERYLGFVAERTGSPQGVLLMSHMASPAQLAAQCALMVGYGAQAVGIFDSAGHYLPRDVTERVEAIARAVDVPIIFHAHNNLGMGIANAVAAVEAGASVLDACARGIGAGAGNAQLEVLVAVLERMGYSTGVDLASICRASDLAHDLLAQPPAIDSVSLVSGLAGVFSGFKNRVLTVARQEGVDPLELFFELGVQQVVAGQEDLVLDVAVQMKAGLNGVA